VSAPPGRLVTALADRYRVERTLGEGGMATVYLAADLKHDRPVALKVLRPELAAVVGAERFVAEIRTTANLQHPHILPLFDSGESDGFLWYVMPWVEGESLEERLAREKQLPVDEAVAIAVKVAGALQVAHEHGVIHRDIKPANVLLGRGGEPLVADFGIALAVQEAGGGRLTETGLSLGTPHYMSPEQATADRDPDPRSDVYALGCVLYQMLAGEPPFSGGTAQAILGRILTADPEPPSRVRRSVPPHVEAAVLRALEKTPADRFPSAADFARALQDPASGAPGGHVAARTATTRAGPASSRGRPAAGRAWVPWAAAALLGLSAAWGWLRAPAVASRPPSVLALPLPADEGDTRIALSPDGRTFAASDDQGPIRVRRLEDAEWRPLAGTDGARDVAFSPDGLHLAFERERAILRVPVAGGAPLTLVPPRDEEAYELHWGEDGHIAFVGDVGVFRVAAAGGGLETLLAGVNAADPFVLPDGSILFWYFGPGGLALLEPAADSARSLLVEGVRPVYLASGYIVYGVPGGGLRAVPFDAGAGRVTGASVPLMDGVDARDWSLSGQGTLVYQRAGGGFAAGMTSRLVRADAEGRLLDTLPLPAQRIVGLELSPDGGAVALVTEGRETDFTQLFTYDLRRLDGPRRLTDEVIVLRDVVWTAGGDSIVYAAMDAGNPDLFIRPREGGERRILRRSTRGLQVSDLDPSGALLGSSAGGGDGGDLVRFPMDPEGAVGTFLSTPREERTLRVSPDGRWGAYVSQDETGASIFLRSFPDGLAPRVVAPGDFPRWSPDGSRLYFVRGVTGPVLDTLKAVEVQGDGAVGGAPRALLAFDHWGYDVFPDGDLLLALGTAPEALSATGGVGTEERIVVLDWLASIQERLGR
jgi:serine/threonine-protein kinase